ncbi:MAG: leucine-rich repeat domain-containing protein [Oscillospiraceae bacterium]|nr:leucine-rich repeat domain-containing protein [Oscillospiraceae bacterium]
MQGAVTIPSTINVDGTVLPVTKITSSFYYSGSNRNYITDLTIPDSIKTIDGCPFNGMANLQSVTFSDNLLVIPESLFGGCSNLKSVKLPANLLEIGSNAFHDCVRLTDIKLPSKIMTIGSSAFKGCSNLTSVTIPATLTKIPMYCFQDCSLLKNVTIENGVQVVENQAFSNCKVLEDITFPASVNEIEYYTILEGCQNLKSITLENPEMTVPSFRGTEDAKLTIYGYENSTAQKYCEENSERYYVEFKTLGEKPEPPAAPDYGDFGDVSGNGAIGLEDAQMVLKYYVQQAGQATPSWYEITNHNPKAPDAP